MSNASVWSFRRDFNNPVGINNLNVTAFWTTDFATDVLVNPCAIRFHENFEAGTALATPASNTANHYAEDI